MTSGGAESLKMAELTPMTFAHSAQHIKDSCEHSTSGETDFGKTDNVREVAYSITMRKWK